jgi:SAM-dependent methyltransferase
MEAVEYEVMFAQEGTHWWYGALHQLIRNSLDSQLPGWHTASILDAGCGSGGVLTMLGSRSTHVGVDLSPEAIAFCRQRGLRRLCRSDVTNLPFADASFDAVICSSVLYHRWVADVGVVIRELRRVLRPGGVLLVNLPAYELLRSRHDDLVFTGRRFRLREVRQLLVSGGFAVGRLTYWTTLLFPAALAARTLGASRTGRDYDQSGRAATGWLLRMIMAVELALLRLTPLPFGVAIFGIARARPIPGTVSAHQGSGKESRNSRQSPGQAGARGTHHSTA